MDFIERWVGKSAAEGISAEDVQTFVNRSLDEGLNLEYKSIAKLSDPGTLRKAVCAFANSDGGLLVIGVSAKRGKNDGQLDIEWNTDSKRDKEWLQDVTVNLIRPTIRGTEIVTVRNQEGGSLFLVNVPSSMSPPHMADGVYYFRNGAESRPMEHYQVADAFGKRRRPVLKPKVTLSFYDATKKTVEMTYSVANDGHALAKWLMVNIRFSFCKKLESLSDGLWAKAAETSCPVANTQEWTASYESPINVLHPAMWRKLGNLRIHLEHPLTMVAVTVGAEDAPTDTYLTVISADWLRAKAESPDYQARYPLELPLLGCGDAFNLEQMESLRPLADSVEKDVGQMSQDVMFKMINIALIQLGNDAILSLSEKVQALMKEQERDESQGDACGDQEEGV